jgi:hypothetical protein
MANSLQIMNKRLVLLNPVSNFDLRDMLKNKDNQKAWFLDREVHSLKEKKSTKKASRAMTQVMSKQNLLKDQTKRRTKRKTKRKADYYNKWNKLK